jgi:hypothetical protein
MKTISGIAVLVTGILLTGCTVANPAEYSGTFKDAEITVTLSGQEGRYTGTIQMGEKTFPLSARKVGDALRGTFESEGHKFDVEMNLKGNTLVLVTEETTYKLEKATPAVNPLARPAKAAEEAKPAAAAGPAAPASVLRLKKVSITDQSDMIGGEAFTFLAPADWQVDGGIIWRLSPTMPAAVSLRVFNPKGLEQLEVFPAMAYSYGSSLGPGTFFPIGSNYLGNEVQPPVRDALAYLKERLLLRARGSAGARLVGEEALPKLAEAVAQAEGTTSQGMAPATHYTAGRIRIEYSVSGKPVQEDLFCVLNTLHLPAGNMTIQIADKLSGLRAGKGQLDAQTRLFQTIIFSTRVNLGWFSRYTQLVQALIQMQMQKIRSAGEISRIISRTSSEISEMNRRSWEERQASQDRINKNWSQYMRGVDEYYNPGEQRPVELPSGYSSAWVNGRGEYVLTDSVNFNPNVDLGGDWQKLRRNGE